VDLTARQQEILAYVNTHVDEHGYPPTVREIGQAVGLTSPSTVHAHLEKLAKAGLIRRDATKPRALEVVKLPQQATAAAPPKGRAPFKPQLVEASASVPGAANDTRELPILGKIAAGTPIEAIQQERDRIQVPEAILGAGEHFVLEIQGDSMINAGILDGDFVVIKRGDTATSGDIVVALVMGEEATLKRLRKKGASIALEAANPAYETRIFGLDQVAVQGKLVGLIRRYH